MSRRTDRSRWSEARARRELAAWKRSGESLAAYARKHGYTAQRLAWWRKRLGREEALELAAVDLAPAVVVGTTRPAVTLAITGSEIRVEIDDPGAVHPVWLAELAAGLRGAQQR